jgi:hypothetical protein
VVEEVKLELEREVGKFRFKHPPDMGFGEEARPHRPLSQPAGEIYSTRRCLQQFYYIICIYVYVCVQSWYIYYRPGDTAR